MELLIKHGRIVDSSQDFIGDIYIKEGIISEIGLNLQKTCKVFDAKGKTVMPAFVDLHCHFRDPGYTYKEDLYSGSRAAARGGYTLVNLMANTNPICSNMEVVNYVKQKVEEIGLVEVHQVVSITEGLKGESLVNLENLTEEVKFISDDGKGVNSDKVMYEALIKAKEKNIRVISHAETSAFSAIDMRIAENIMTNRDIELCGYTQGKLHMAHVSTKEAIEYVKRGKQRGVDITCEVTPHHLIYKDEIETYRVNPPIREKEDVEAVINGIKYNYVDAIATDHAPHTKEDKEKGAPGISGIETSFSISYTKLVKGGHISLNRLSELMSKNPGKIMGWNKGEIKIGYDGDLVLIDLEHNYEIKSEEFHSKGKNTPFNHMNVYGKVLLTIRKGKVVYKDNDYTF